MTIKKTQLHKFIYLSNVDIYMSARKEEIKINENIAVNEPEFNEKNTTNLTKTTIISMKEQIMP